MPEPKSPFKRVRRAFDPEVLKRVCEMHENDFAGAYQMKETQIYSRRAPDDFYLHLDRGSSILAVAHLDTVVEHSRRMTNFCDTAAGPVVHSGALDDRLGAYTILELLPRLGVDVDVLLTVGEESGQSTAEFFQPDKDYHWMIEFDRGGTDVVMYQYEDDLLCDLVTGAGARVGSGSFSDIAFMEHLGKKGFNWGVGYHDYHGPRGYAYLEDYWKMIGHYLQLHEVWSDTPLPHEEKPVSSMWGGGRSSTYGRGGWWDQTEECAGWCGRMVDEVDETGLCTACAAELEESENEDAGDLVSDDFNIVNERLLALDAADKHHEYDHGLWS